jgi:folate transporter 1
LRTPAGTFIDPSAWIGFHGVLCLFYVVSPLIPAILFLQVTNEINPILSYSYMAVLVPVFLLTDVLRYKPVLVLSSLSHVAIWLLLLLGSSLLEMQFMEFFYGITMAARVAYSSYIFSLVTPELYQRVASYSRSCVLMGVFASSVLGQVLISVGRLSFATLSVVSLALVSFGLVLSVCLPWPKRSLFFNRAHHAAQRNLQEQAAAQSELARMKQGEAGLGSGDTPSLAPLSSGSSWRDSVFIQMLKELRNVPRRPSLRLWSQWWVFNSAGYYLVLLYVHVLWNKVYPATENKHVYNGGVEAVSTLLGEGSISLGFSLGTKALQSQVYKCFNNQYVAFTWVFTV